MKRLSSKHLWLKRARSMGVPLKHASLTGLMLAALCVLQVGLPSQAPLAASAPTDTVSIDGEVFARRTATLMPPSVEQVWMFNIAQLVADGSRVKQGEVVMAFDTGEITRQLVDKRSALNERRSQLEKLSLDLAERERNERVTTAQARANQGKAQTKTSLPAELVGGIAYAKLMIERQRSEQLMALALVRERAAAEQRVQERRLLAAEVAQLQADVRQLEKSIDAMVITAPRSGVVMHMSSWRGEKFDVGSQVWRGQAVAEIPDVSALAVRALLPERDLPRVKAGTLARIVVEGGGGRVLRGKVASVGRVVRSRSRSQPVPILDMEIDPLDATAGLRPGQTVRVELSVSAAQAGTR